MRTICDSMFTPTDIAAMNRKLAYIYMRGADTEVPLSIANECADAVDDLFYRIPLLPHFVDFDPYKSWDEMSRAIENGCWEVRCSKPISRVFGRHYQKFRAAHDWYGHYLAGNCFGLVGELSAYGVHCMQFPTSMQPLIWNELILVNAYKDHFGDYPPDDKLVIMKPDFTMHRIAQHMAQQCETEPAALVPERENVHRFAIIG